MAKQKSQTVFSSFYVKSVLATLVVAVSTFSIVVLSDPKSATASVSPEACATDEVANDDSSSYSRAGFTAQTGVKPEDSLFWDSLTKSWMTEEQVALMIKTYQIGLEDGGHEHAEMLQAVLLQETIAGHLGRIGHMTAPVGKRSYGIMQVKVSAARDMLRKHKEFGRFRADELLIAKLLTDDEFNIRIASKFLLHLNSKAKTVDKSLVAYNIGLRASRKVSKPQEFKYVVRTKLKLTEVVRPFNQRFNNVSDTLKVAMR